MLMMPTVVNAEGMLCKTIEECNSRRLATHDIFQKMYLNSEQLESGTVLIDQRFNHQIYILDLASKIDASKITWTQMTGKNGTTLSWSSVLPGKYSNCISFKDKNGLLAYESGRSLDVDTFFSRCRDDNQNDIYDDFSEQNLVIEDSDAIQACKLAGGRLPTLEDFKNFIENETFLNLPGTEGHWFWSSTVQLGHLNQAYYLNVSYDLFIVPHYWSNEDYYRNYISFVRCIK